MLHIARTSTDPFFNIAAEEYFLKHFSEELFMLWINKPCVVVGKHQNAFAEVNHRFVMENRIPVIRRISGGGTVYHDTGNLNYTIILNGEQGKLVDYKKYTQPIIQSLRKLGLNTYLNKKSSLFIEGRKFSGNAEHIYKNRVIHHGTLLFSTNLDHLEQAIKSKENTYTGKAVKSVRSSVTNLAGHLTEPMNILEFKDFLTGFFKHFYQTTDYITSETDHAGIRQYVNNRYSLWEWNYGYSPSFSKRLNSIFLKTPGDIEIHVDKGWIREVTFKGERKGWVQDFSEALRDKRYRQDEIRMSMNSTKFANHLDTDHFIQELF